MVGTIQDYLTARNIKMDTGSFFNDQQIKSSAKVAVLGATTRDDLFGANTNPIGQSIRIRNGSGDELFVQIVPSTLEIDNHIIRP